jgi:hypothetical protein
MDFTHYGYLVSRLLWLCFVLARLSDDWMVLLNLRPPQEDEAASYKTEYAPSNGSRP